MVVPVNRSAPVSTIITKPMGKIKAPIILIRPGALSWNQGAVLALSAAAEAKHSRQPADTAERKTLSGRIFPFFTPARETNSIVSAGVYPAMLVTLTFVMLAMFSMMAT